MPITRVVRFLAVLTAVVALCISSVTAQTVRLYMTDGRVITGDLVAEDDTNVTVRIAQINTRFARSDIRRIEQVQSPADEYAERRAEIPDTDIDGRYALINWLYEQREYELALRELQVLEADAPDDERIVLLRRAAEQQLRLREQRTQPAQQQQERPTERPDAPRQAGADNLLTEEQIHLIRVYEIDLDERPPVVVPPEVVERIFTEYADHESTPRGPREQDAFRRAPGWQKLDVLFELRARPLYSEVRVRTDPPAMATFRREVHTHYVVNYCGSVQCHGSPNDSDLLLVRDARNRDQQVYTNFFILNAYENEDGRMINRNDPSRSLLLQYGLERRAARTPHPEVPGYRHQFHNTEAPRYQAIANWISMLFGNPPQNYGIDFVPPGRSGEPEASEE